jgi:segregation and condensation protein B
MRIEAIRGVRSDGVLRSLVRRGLIEAVDRAETVGRPILFGTTFEFLQQFGLEALSDLPNWDELSSRLKAREAGKLSENSAST